MTQRQISGVTVYVTVQQFFVPIPGDPKNYQLSDYLLAAFSLKEPPTALIVGEYVKNDGLPIAFADRDQAVEAAFKAAADRISNR